MFVLLVAFDYVMQCLFSSSTSAVISAVYIYISVLIYVYELGEIYALAMEYNTFGFQLIKLLVG